MSEDGAPFFIYRAKLERIVDGDTIDVLADLGFRTTRTIRVRLLNVDTAETYGVPAESEEAERGRTHTQFVHEWMADVDDREWPLIVITQKDHTGRYGRYLAEVVRRSDGAVLNDDLVSEFPSTATE